MRLCDLMRTRADRSTVGPTIYARLSSAIDSACRNGDFAQLTRIESFGYVLCTAFVGVSEFRIRDCARPSQQTTQQPRARAPHI